MTGLLKRYVAADFAELEFDGHRANHAVKYADVVELFKDAAEAEPVGRGFFTKDQLATRWQVNERYIRNLVNTGKLDGIKLGDGPTSPFRIARKSVKEYESAHSVHISPKRK